MVFTKVDKKNKAGYKVLCFKINVYFHSYTQNYEHLKCFSTLTWKVKDVHVLVTEYFG